jgi:hypothetical protein
MITDKPRRPLPDPDAFQDIRAWAKELTNFFQQERVTGLLQKDPVLLPHQMANQISRATIDGIMMFDPSALAPVVSVSGVWQLLLSGNIATIRAGVETTTAGEVEVVLDPPMAGQPLVFGFVEAMPANNEAFVCNAYGITDAGFTLTARIVDTAFSTPVRPLDGGTVYWLAVLPY